MRALLIVDLQNDFLPGGALGVHGGDEIISLINDLISHFPIILATKDWHPPHHMSFASQHPEKKPFETIAIGSRTQELWPDHCVQGSEGAEFAPGLHTEHISEVFYKGVDPEIDSYSAFFDNAHLRSTGLAEYLKEQGIDELYIVGLATDYCVKYSVLDARRLGFKTYVIVDGCRGIDLKQGDIATALAAMQQAGAHLLMSNALVG